MEANFEYRGAGVRPNRRTRRARLRNFAGATLVAGAAASGLFVAQTAGAATHPAKSSAHRSSGRAAPDRPKIGAGSEAPTAAGKVTAVDAASDTFTIDERDGTSITVEVSASTTYTDPQDSSPSLSDVTVGEQVGVVGTLSSDTVAATEVLIGMPGPAGPGPRGGTPPTATGKVTAVDAASDTFTIDEQDGTSITVEVSGSTTYTDPGDSSATLANVEVGDVVAIDGTLASGSLTASSVTVCDPSLAGPGGTPPTATGKVTAVDAASDTFTIDEQDGTSVTVEVSGSTTYLDPKVSSASLADVSVGEQVAVVGTSSSGTVTASTVMIGTPPRPSGKPSGAPGPGGPGGGPGGPGGFTGAAAAPTS